MYITDIFTTFTSAHVSFSHFIACVVKRMLECARARAYVCVGSHIAAASCDEPQACTSVHHMAPPVTVWAVTFVRTSRKRTRVQTCPRLPPLPSYLHHVFRCRWSRP